MLTTDAMVDVWNEFAKQHSLETEARENGNGLSALSMKGDYNGVPIVLTYAQVRVQHDLVNTAPIDNPLASPFSMQAMGYQLRGTVRGKVQKKGTIHITKDPIPTYRKVASWFGGGDPTVGDKAFDDAYLIDTSDESLLREVVTDALRKALQEGSSMNAEFRYKDGSYEVELNLVMNGEKAIQAAVALLLAAKA